MTAAFEDFLLATRQTLGGTHVSSLPSSLPSANAAVVVSTPSTNRAP